MYRRTDVSRGSLKGLKRDRQCCCFNPKAPVLIRYNFFSVFVFCIPKETIFSYMDSALL